MLGKILITFFLKELLIGLFLVEMLVVFIRQIPHIPFSTFLSRQRPALSLSMKLNRWKKSMKLRQTYQI